MKLIRDYEHPCTKTVVFRVEKGCTELVHGYDPTLLVTPEEVTVTYAWTATEAAWSAKVKGPCPAGHHQERATVKIWSPTSTVPDWFRRAVEEQAPPEWTVINEQGDLL